MLSHMLDADLCIHLVRQTNRVLLVRFRETGQNLSVSTIVQTELMVGVEKSPDPTQAGERVERLLARVTVLPFDEAAAAHAASIRAYLEAVGRKIGAYDGLIAGHARSLGLTLVSGNTHEFSRVPGLLHEDWLTGLKDGDR